MYEKPWEVLAKQLRERIQDSAGMKDSLGLSEHVEVSITPKKKEPFNGPTKEE